jgi:hypothetical protein
MFQKFMAHAALALSVAGMRRFASSKIKLCLLVGNSAMLVFCAGCMHTSRTGIPHAPASATLSMQPAEVMAGEAIRITAVPANFPITNRLTYAWNSSGGKLVAGDATAMIDTAGLAAGEYAVSVQVSDGHDHVAESSERFVVKEAPRNPPTIACSATTASLQRGEVANFTCDCQSPDGRGVAIEWSASGGRITGSGTTATLDTTDLAGGVTVTATCKDDRGLSTTGSVSVNVAAASVSVAARPICEIAFTSTARPSALSPAAAACLDSVALLLLGDPNAKAVLVGEQEADERPSTVAAQRAVNAKAYLTSGGEMLGIHGSPIAASRIEPRTGAAHAKTVEAWMVPEGAAFDVQSTLGVDEDKIRPQLPTASGKPAITKVSVGEPQSCPGIAVLVYPKQVNLFTFLPNPFRVDLLIALRPGPDFANAAAKLDLCDQDETGNSCRSVFTGICREHRQPKLNSDNEVDAEPLSDKVSGAIKAELPVGGDFGLDYADDNAINLGPNGFNAWHWNITPKNDFNGRIRVVVRPTKAGAKSLLDRDVEIQTPGRLLRGMLVGGGTLSILLGGVFGFVKWWYNEGRKKKEQPAAPQSVVPQPVEIHIHMAGGAQAPPTTKVEPSPPITREREAPKKWIN